MISFKLIRKRKLIKAVIKTVSATIFNMIVNTYHDSLSCQVLCKLPNSSLKVTNLSSWHSARAFSSGLCLDFIQQTRVQTHERLCQVHLWRLDEEFAFMPNEVCKHEKRKNKLERVWDYVIKGCQSSHMTTTVRATFGLKS